MTATLEQEAQKLSLSNGAQAPKRSAISPAPAIVNRTVVGEWEDAIKAYKGPKLNQHAIDSPSWYGAERLDHLFRTTYEPKTNPDGMINLAIAENSLMTAEYLKYYGEVFQKAITSVDLTYGDQAAGSKRLNCAIADLWNENFAPVKPVHPDDVITGPGLSSVLDQLMMCLCAEGEVVLIRAPHYNGFDVNMVARTRCVPYHVQVSETVESFTEPGVEIAALEKAYEECTAKGQTVRAVLLVNPHNPLGLTYSKEVILDYARFCEKHDLHLVSDEIYALSTYENPKIPDAPGFISVAAIDFEKELGKFDNSRVNIVYSFSKDFGINGFRVACVISQHNPFLLRTMLHYAFLMKISSPADALISYMLNDKPSFKRFTKRNCELLGKNAKYVSDWFEQRGCKPIQGNAGHFIVVDCREKLGIKTFEEEKDFGRHAIEYGASVGIGQVYHFPTPGFARITFTIEPETLRVALERLDKAIEAWTNKS